MQYLKYIFFAVGFVLLMATNLMYQTRNSRNPDKSEPYNEKEKLMKKIGYGCFITAILLIIIFN